MSTLKEEVDILLSKIEAELLEFVSFIRHMEDDYDSFHGKKLKPRHLPEQNSPSNSNFDDREDNISGSAISDAFQIVEIFLLRISSLLEQFASLPTTDERNLKDSYAYDFKKYYLQYVYQIASYLVNILQEYLEKFSDKLNELASPLPSDEDDKKEYPKEKSIYINQVNKLPPRYFRLKSYIPKNFDTMYEQPQRTWRTYREKSSSESPSRHSENDQNEYRSSDTKRYEIYITHEDKRRSLDIPTEKSDDLVRIEKSLHELSKLFHTVYSVVLNQRDTKKDFETVPNLLHDLSRMVDSLQELVKLLQVMCLHNDKEKRDDPTALNSSSVNNTIRDDKIPHRKINMEDSCSDECTKCCGGCKKEHLKTRKNEDLEECCKDSLYLAEPYWLHSTCTKPRKDSRSKKRTHRTHPKTSEEKKYNGHEFSREKDIEDRGTETPFQLPESSTLTKEVESDRRHPLDSKYKTTCKDKESSSFDNCNEISTSDHATGKATRRSSTSTLHSLLPELKRHHSKTISPVRSLTIVQERHLNMPVGLASFKAESTQTQYTDYNGFVATETERQTRDSERKRKPEKGTKREDSPESDSRPYYLKDFAEKDTTFGKFCRFRRLSWPYTKHDSTTAILYEKAHKSSEESTRAIVLDIEKFSTLLKEHFKDYLEHSAEMSEIVEEPAIILSIIIDSICDAVNFCTGTDEVKHDKEPHKETEQAQAIYTEDKSGGAEDEIFISKDLRKAKCSGPTVQAPPCNTEKQETINYACEVCQWMVDPIVCGVGGPHSCTEKCLMTQSLKVSCSTCLNHRERGLTIHKCHENIPDGVLEIRHMDKSGKICVCYLFWNRKKELDDWRWQKNPFQDSTRVEFERETDSERDAILKVIFGPEGTMLKESLAETQLQMVCDNFQDRSAKVGQVGLTRNASCTTGLYLHYRKQQYDDKKMKELKIPKFSESERKLLTKIGRFFDDIMRVGYGKGPPLVLKLRNSSALHDAYDLLTAPSKIRLNYYRSLRVLFIPRDDYNIKPTTTNFQMENQIDELFRLFERRLFGSSEKNLFIRPCEETQCIYFNPYPNSHPQWFVLSGIVLALAILHQKKLDVRLPVCLFKCLLDRVLTIEDLKELEPLVYQKLKWMKENDIRTMQTKMTFTIKEVMGGGVQENELMVNGSKIAVTEKNKFRYIDLMVKWKLAERCLTQLNDFRKGFVSVIDPSFLTHFTEIELRSLIRNPPDPIFFQQECRSDKIFDRMERRLTE